MMNTTTSSKLSARDDACCALCCGTSSGCEYGRGGSVGVGGHHAGAQEPSVWGLYYEEGNADFHQVLRSLRTRKREGFLVSHRLKIVKFMNLG